MTPDACQSIRRNFPLKHPANKSYVLSYTDKRYDTQKEQSLAITCFKFGSLY